MVDPLGLCLLTWVLRDARSYNQVIEFVDLDPSIDGYLQRMNVFQVAGIEREEHFRRHDRRSSLCEVRRIDDRDEVDPVSIDLANTLVGKLFPSYREAKPDEMTGRAPGDLAIRTIQYALSEIMGNSLSHGRRHGHHTAAALAAAQHFSKPDMVAIAVIDDGCGLLGSLEKHPVLTAPTHEAAIQAALQPRVSCNPDVDLRPDDTANQGFGLTVVREIVREGNGNFYLATGDKALVSRSKMEICWTIPEWSGTLLVVELPRRSIDQIRIEDAIKRYYDQGNTGDITLNFT